MKVCRTCGHEKEEESFYIGKSDCKRCIINKSKERYYSVGKKEITNKYQTDEKFRLKRIEYAKKYIKNNQEKVYAKKKERRNRNPKKTKAHNKVTYKIFTGEIKRKPCEVCGDPKSEAHHENYDKPLDVRWLCFRHHREAHGQYRYYRVEKLLYELKKRRGLL